MLIQSSRSGSVVSASSLDGFDRSRRHPVALKVKYLAVEGGKSEIAFQSLAARSLVGVLDELPYVSGNVLVPAIQWPKAIDGGRGGQWPKSLVLELRSAWSPQVCLQSSQLGPLSDVQLRKVRRYFGRFCRLHVNEPSQQRLHLAPQRHVSPSSSTNG